MSEKRSVSKSLKIGISILIFITLFQTIGHIIIYGTGIPSLYEDGEYEINLRFITISEKLDSEYPLISTVSKISLITEWLLLIYLMYISYKTKQNMKEENAQKEQMEEIMKRDRTKTKTDLDILYDVLKEKKKIKVSTAAKAFNVDKKIINEWCDILEEGNLATMNYPKMSEPEITLIEEKNEERK
jgi:hypothetical protein